MSKTRQHGVYSISFASLCGRASAGIVQERRDGKQLLSRERDAERDISRRRIAIAGRLLKLPESP
jgi:hypothetical protein